MGCDHHRRGWFRPLQFHPATVPDKFAGLGAAAAAAGAGAGRVAVQQVLRCYSTRRPASIQSAPTAATAPTPPQRVPCIGQRCCAAAHSCTRYDDSDGPGAEFLGEGCASNARWLPGVDLMGKLLMGRRRSAEES